MGRSPSPHTVAIRDRLLAILRDEYPLPISTNQVLKAMTNEGRCCNAYTAPDDGSCAHVANDNLSFIEHNDGCPGWCWHSPVYTSLRRLSDLGLVEKMKCGEMRAVFWRYIKQDEHDDAFDEIVKTSWGNG